MDNKITTILSPEVANRVITAIQGIYNDMNFLIELTPSESKRITRMEAGRSDFVRMALLLANGNEKLRPQFYEMSEMEKDLNFCQAFDVLIAEVGRLHKQMVDTRDQAGHEAYSAALEIYNTTKRATARGIPGAQLAYEELKAMFNGNGKPNKDDQATAK